MTKIRINKEMRQAALTAVRKTTHAVAEKEALTAAQNAVGQKALDYIMRMYPDEDMLILEKYEQSRIITSIQMPGSIDWVDVDGEVHKSYVDVSVSAVRVPQSVTGWHGPLSREINHRFGAELPTLFATERRMSTELHRALYQIIRAAKTLDDIAQIPCAYEAAKAKYTPTNTALAVDLADAWKTVKSLGKL